MLPVSVFIVLLWYFIYLCNVRVDWTALTSFCSVYRLRHIRTYVRPTQVYIASLSLQLRQNTIHYLCHFFSKGFVLLKLWFACVLYTYWFDWYFIYALKFIYFGIWRFIYIDLFAIFFIHTLKLDWFILIWYLVYYLLIVHFIHLYCIYILFTYVLLVQEAALTRESENGIFFSSISFLIVWLTDAWFLSLRPLL